MHSFIIVLCLEYIINCTSSYNNPISHYRFLQFLEIDDGRLTLIYNKLDLYSYFMNSSLGITRIVYSKCD